MSKHKKKPVISFYYYRDKDVDNKAHLFNILEDLHEQYPNNVADLTELVDSGNFERICRFLMPQTLTQVMEYDTIKNEATIFYDPNREYIKDSPFNDVINFLEETDLHLISSHSTKEIDQKELIDELFNDKKAKVILKEISDDYTKQWISPVSETQWAREMTDINDEKLLPHHFLMTATDTFDVVAQFEKELSLKIKDSVIPTDEGMKTFIYQMMFYGYRLTAAKVSKLSKPVIYSDRLDKTEEILTMIANPNISIMEDWDKDMKIVRNEDVMSFIDKQSTLVNDPKLPLSDLLDESQPLYRYLYTLGTGNSLDTAENKHSFDVICNKEAVLDEVNHKIMLPVHNM